MKKRVPIPDDWTEEDGYCLAFFCLPNSPLWRAIYRGSFYELTWWNKWDQDTGLINEAKAIANDVLESLCMANCDELITALNNISDGLAAIGDLSELAQITAQLTTLNAGLAGWNINDISANIGNLDLSELANIATNVEAFRSTFETRSVAAVVAQNTNTTALTTAISGFVPVTCRSCGGSGCGSCGGIGGYVEPTPDAVEGEEPPLVYGGIITWTPPAGYPSAPGQPGGTAYYDRKCKMANAIHEDIVSMITQLHDLNIETLTGSTLNALLGISMGLVISEAIVVVPIIETLLLLGGELLIDLVTELLILDFDFPFLLSKLDSEAEDLVCALYESTEGNQAKDNYLQILENVGVGIDDRRVVEILMFADVYNHLYWLGDGFIEARMAAYDPPYPCNDCACDNYVEADSVDFSVGTHTWDAVYHAGLDQYRIVINYCHQGATKLDTTFNSITGYTDNPGNIDFRLFSYPTLEPGPGDIYSSDDFPTGQRHQWQTLIFWSNTDFTMNITVHGEV